MTSTQDLLYRRCMIQEALPVRRSQIRTRALYFVYKAENNPAVLVIYELIDRKERFL